MFNSAQGYNRTVTYQFNTPYTYQGGCLVIDISNMDSPRTQTNNEVIFNLSRMQEACYMTDNMFYVQAGCPDIIVQFEQTGTAPILYLPFYNRKVNCGFLNIGESKDFRMEVCNLGNQNLVVSSVSQPLVSSGGGIITAQHCGNLSFSVHPDQAGFFNVTIPVNSDGGTGTVSFTGTTYKRRRAVCHAELSESRRLESYYFDPNIAELSVSGLMQAKDWIYIGEHFENLQYLNLLEATYESSYLPAIQNAFRSNKTLKLLALPMNILNIDYSFFTKYQITSLRQIVLPFEMEYIQPDLSVCPNLKTIVSFAQTPPSGNESFVGNISDIYVPENALLEYQQSYLWRNKNIYPITEDILNWNGNSVILDFEDGNNMTESSFINYGVEQTRNQLFFPEKVLNLPKGTKIRSLRFKFNISNYNQIQTQNGTMKISVTETMEPMLQDFVEPGVTYYEGSDLLDFSVPNYTSQYVTYQFTEPYEYKGGCLVLDFVSTPRQVITDYNFSISTYINRIEEIGRLCDSGSGYPINYSEKPNIGMGISTEGVMEQPIAYIPYHSRSFSLGYAGEGEAANSYLNVQNLGGSPLEIMQRQEIPFEITGATIPAHSDGLVEVRFYPDHKNSFERDILLETNGGLIPIRMAGTSYRQAPYQKEVILPQNERLRNIIINPEEITELSVTGNLIEEDLSFLGNQCPKLRYLDLSTATISPLSGSYNLFSTELVQLALPTNMKTLRLDNRMPLLKLILPVSLQSIENQIPEQLTTLISFAVTPPKVNEWTISGIQTVYVPMEAVWKYQNTYPWSNREIKPITDDVLSTDWTSGKRMILIQGDVAYNEWDAPRGNPNILVMPNTNQSLTGSLINQAPLEVDTLLLVSGLNRRYNSGGGSLYEDYSYYSSFINHSASPHISNVGYILQAEFGVWHYLSFPFDVDLADIQRDNDWQYVFRYYDGAARAQNGIGESWKNVTDGVLRAGTGYIFQADNSLYYQGAMVILTNAADNIQSFVNPESKQIRMNTHPSANPEDKSWNFVGNPYPSFFDIHKIEYAAPIVIWNGEGYIALSLTDDNYALRPFEAFFSQKPLDDEAYGMTFKPEGRQINSYITNPVLRAAMFSSRRQVNLTFSGADYSDRSRVVINPDAKMAYELTCDAAKWMSPNPNIPQLYSLDDEGRRYAINERPEGTGQVSLGIYVGKAGDYTLALPADEVSEPVILKDTYLNKEVDLSEESYTFRADIGTFDDRFQLLLSASGATNREDTASKTSEVYVQKGNLMVKAPVGSLIQVYTTTGTLQQSLKMADASAVIALPAGFYLVKIGEKTHKVIIH